MRRRVSALGAGIVLAGAITRCAGAPPPRGAVESSPSTSTARAASAVHFESLDAAEPPLLALEDQRKFDPAILEAAVGAQSAAVRARAALALGRIGDPRAADPLRRLLADPAPEVRAAAAFASAIGGDPALTAAIVPLLADTNTGVAGRAGWALGFLALPAGQDALIAALAKAPPPELAAAWLRALWRFSTPAAAAAALARATDGEGQVRAAAVYALARRPLEASLPPLAAALSDADADTAAIAARGLGVIARLEAIAPLSAAIDSRRVALAINAMLALENTLEKNPAERLPVEAAPRLLELSGDANPNLAVPALTLLRWLTDDREAFRRLWSTASGGRGRRRQVALQSLMAGLGPKSEALIDAAIAEPDPFLRAAAAEALAFLPEPDAAPRRERLAADPEVVVRLKVLEGLNTPELARSNRALVDAALSDRDPGVRAAALDALASLEDPGTLPLFTQAVLASYGEAPPDVPIEAIAAAEKQAARPEARAVVEAAYRHPSTLVSRLARRSLVQKFHADPAQWPARTYATGKSAADYAALLADARKPWLARVETARGSFTIRLAGAEAPMTVMNFVTLARRFYFDGAPIHRVVPNFVVQDGDPTGTGNGGPGYEIRDEINTIPYGAGTVGMALAGADTGGSQWFVTQAPQPHLDGGYTVFGQVSAGMDVVRRIEQGDTILHVTVSEGP